MIICFDLGTLESSLGGSLGGLSPLVLFVKAGDLVWKRSWDAFGETKGDPMDEASDCDASLSVSSKLSDEASLNTSESPLNLFCGCLRITRGADNDAEATEYIDRGTTVFAVFGWDMGDSGAVVDMRGMGSPT